MNAGSGGSLARAEAAFRDAVHQEQMALMSSGISRVKATEILLARLRGKTGVSASSEPVSPDGWHASSPPPGFSQAELEVLVNVHGYTEEDAARALTICHEIRRMQAGGIGAAAATEELMRRILSSDRGAADEGSGHAGVTSTRSGCSSQATSIPDDPPRQEQRELSTPPQAAILGPISSRDSSTATAFRETGGRMESDEQSTEPGAVPAEAVPLQSGSSPQQPSDQKGSREKGRHESIPLLSSRGDAEATATRTPSGAGPSPARTSGRKRQHASTLLHHAGGVDEQGMFPPPSPRRAASAGGAVFAWGSAATEASGVENRPAVGCASSSSPLGSGVPLQGSHAIVSRDSFKKGGGMDASRPSASLAAPVAKRPRCLPGECGGGQAGRKGPEARQMRFVDDAEGPEDQEQQLQLAFHQLGVRQRNAPPSPPLISVMPPKRPRNPGDDPSHGKRPRNG